MKQEWLTSRELAGIGGLPGSRRRVADRAERDGWQWRERAGRGGGREYFVGSLPELVRAELAKASEAAAAPEPAEAQPAPNAKESSLAVFAALSVRRQAKAYARLELLGLSDAYAASSVFPRREALDRFCAEYSAGRITAPDHVRIAVKSLDRATLYRWQLAHRQGGLLGLAGGRAGAPPAGKVASSPELGEIIIGLIAAAPHIMPVRVWEYLEANHAELIARVNPSRKGVQRWMERWKRENPALLAMATNPDRYKNEFLVAFGNAAESVARLNQLWELDATPSDVMLADGRHSILGCIDVYSRRLKLLVSKTSKATAVSLLFRRCLIEWGTPESVRLDNGQEFRSYHFSGVLDGLDINAIFCTPFASEQKPFIERSFRTFSHGILELRPGFIGHNVAERKEIEARDSFATRLMKRSANNEALDDLKSITAAELQTFCDDWCNAVYGRAGHAGLDGRSPFEVASAWTEPVRRIENERALDVLLAEAPDGSGARSVTKKGISAMGAHYIADELAARIGERVLIRLDPNDLGQIVVFDGAGERFVCVAVCPERAGISPKEIAKAAKVRQAQQRADGRKLLERAKRAVTSRDVGQSILDHKIELAKNVTQLPRASTPYSTGRLDAAADAALHLDAGPAPGPAFTAADEAAAARGAQVIELFSERERQERERQQSEERNWPFYWECKNGERPITAEIEAWMRSYETSDEFASLYETATELGGAPWRQMQPKNDKAPVLAGAST